MPDSAVLYIFLSILCIFLVGAFLSLLFSSKLSLSRIVSQTAAIISSALGIFLSLIFLLGFIAHKVVIELNTSFDFFKIVFTIDNLSAFFILMISFLALVVSIYSLGYVKHYEKERNTSILGMLYNLFLCSMILVVTCGHIFVFLIVWELMSLTSYFLVIFENEKPEAQKAGLIYIIMTHIGTAFITAAFILLYVYTGQTVIHLMDTSNIPGFIKCLIFIFFLIGFGTKAGIIPLHIWLPYAHPSAPSNVSALMSGVMIKTAIYGLIRFVIGTLSPDLHWWGVTIIIIGAISTILGVAYALMEHNIKRLLAYHSIENIGIILLGVGLSIVATANGNTMLSALALTGALFHTFNHSVFKGLLFLGAGSIHYATGTKDIEKLGGLIKKMPYTSVFFLVASLSICAIPPFNGFVSEWITYQSMFFSISTESTFSKLIILISAALLAMAGALAAYCFVKVFGISFLAQPRSKHAEEASEVGRPMLVGMGILSAACLVLGIVPMLIIRLIDSINSQLLNTTIFGEIRGFSSFIFYPFKINKTSISPASLFIMLLVLFIIIALIILITKAGKKTRKYGTWDCGYTSLDNRMQYSATGFSKPARIVFRSIFKPGRELKVEEGLPPYFVKSASYTVSTLSLLEAYIYTPTVKRIFNFARKARFKIQTGSIHTYLLYIFITILLMFVYSILVIR